MPQEGLQKWSGELLESITHLIKYCNTSVSSRVHARCNGCLKKQDDFKEIFEKLKTLKLEHYIMHVTGVLYENGNEQYHLPIKKGDMPLAPLIEVIFDNNYNVTLISESPLLEHDAVYMRLQVEKAIMKRTGKEEADYRDLSEIL